jgi:pimeloyl-ACP methyl ester carboxylesterase
VILPGIEGKSPANVSIAKGLDDGGVRSAIEIYDWTTGAAFFGLNLRYLERNKREARHIADRIMDYQDRYPGRPVHLIGHSGGGGVTVLALEALPANRKVTGAILLAAAVAPEYDLRQALRRVDRAVYNFYSPYDVGFLKLGTTIMGTIDGRHTTAAGVRGFRIPWGLNEEGRLLYSEHLRQQRYTGSMARSGHAGGHFGWSDRQFVADWLAPIVHSNSARVRSQATGNAEHDHVYRQSSAQEPHGAAGDGPPLAP